MNLEQVTARFSRAYDKNTDAKKDLSIKQEKMFEAFTKELERGPLSQRSVPMAHWESLQEKERVTWLKKYHPGTRAVGYNEPWLILEEDPTMLKFTFVNPVNKQVYSRTRVEGGPGLDDDALRAEQPDLWERITEWPQPYLYLATTIVRGMSSLRWSDEALADTVGSYLEILGIERVLKEFKDLEDEDLRDMEDYFLPGSVSVRLVPPRAAKPDELEEKSDEEDNE